MPDSPPRLLAFAGSLRQGSYNRRLVHVLAEGAREAGAAVTLIELRDYALPIYDGDIEADGGTRTFGQHVDQAPVVRALAQAAGKGEQAGR